MGAMGNVRGYYATAYAVRFEGSTRVAGREFTAYAGSRSAALHALAAAIPPGYQVLAHSVQTGRAA